MYEVFPVLAGTVIALVVTRFATGRVRNAVYGVAAIVIAMSATIIAGEGWFFVGVDLAEVILTLGVVTTITSRLPRGSQSRHAVDTA